MRVEKVMKKAMVIENMSLREAAKIMSEKGIGSLIIMKDNKIVGIITERDIMKNISKLDKKVYDIMSKEVITVSPNETLDEAADIMAEHKIKRLPVVEDDQLLGIITATDIIANSDTLNEDFFFDE